MFVTWIVILGTILIFLTLILPFLDHCYLFLVKNWVFGLLDRIAPKLTQKIRNNSRTMTPLEGTSYGTPPLKIQNSIV
ncbi:transmembrane protein, putative [Medicago truncatula]|uniref:Transmembrane protein, putative n=1 Tax=Medicago truncatula TaxID=3880 RepID=G7ZUW5_MEDTR|nr:transmembrane protein, putative [Medicago truncatula]